MKKTLRFSRIFIFLISIPFVSQAQNNFPTEERKLSKDIEIREDAFSFFVLGDWGRNGHFNQREVGDIMNEAVPVMDAEFIISTGDNFYYNGIASVDDPYWISSFENVYDGAHLFLPWYVILGNHDYRGNAQAQIDYKQKSRRWNMPDRYYHFNKITDDSTKISFIFLDTAPFELKYYQEENYREAVSAQDTSRQIVWLDSTLSASQDADWIVVTGHHPLYSGGKRISETEDTRQRFEKIFKKHNVDIYLCGHEHDLQHIKPEGTTHYLVSGAGSEVRPTGKMDASLFAASIPGFMGISINKKEALIQTIDYQGNIVYKSKIKIK